MVINNRKFISHGTGGTEKSKIMYWQIKCLVITAFWFTDGYLIAEGAKEL